jgi:hypothetical protein
MLIEEPTIADLRTFGQIHECGLDPSAFVSDDLAKCQRLADELAAAGYTGVASPSAALPGSVNVTLFGPRREMQAWDESNLLIGEYVKVRRVATTPVSRDVLMRVRHRGERHSGLEAWLEGRDVRPGR